MKKTLSPWQASGYGLLITAVVMAGLELGGIIRIDLREVVENFIIFSSWWLVFSLLVYNQDFLWKNRLFLLKVFGLVVALWLLTVTDELAGVPDNPLSIFLLVVFGLSAFAMLAPRFFKQYRSFIVGFYALVFCYFLGARLLVAAPAAYFGHKAVFIPLFFLPIPFVAIFLLYDQWRWFQNLKNEKAAAELAMLKSQINPHFFFNTLHNLHSLTVTQSPQAPEVILTLGKMMRYTIYEGKKEIVPVSAEIEYLLAYLELNKIRHQKSVRIDFRHDCQEGITVAPLLFIILLENAFKHGVEKMTEGAYVDLDLTANAKGIEFRVENNFDPTNPLVPPGIGLANLRRRLELTYPQGFTLETIVGDGVYLVKLSLSPND